MPMAATRAPACTASNDGGHPCDQGIPGWHFYDAMRCDHGELQAELEEEGWEADVAGAEKTVYKWKVAHAEDEVEEKK
jgi:hypothetical protein